MNTKKGFDEKVAAEISKITGYDFITAPNKVCCRQHPSIRMLLADMMIHRIV